MADLTEINEQNLYKEADIRKEKVKLLKEKGINPYANKYNVSHGLLEASNLEEGAFVSVAGRIVFRRDFGKFMFVKVSDIYAKLQVSLSINELGEEAYSFFNSFVDIGDYAGFEGVMYKTKTGELTVKVSSYKLLSKAVLPLPDKYHGLTDTDLKFRQRYLDLIANDETKQVFLTRTKVINHLRSFLNNNGFMEVETPVLQTVASGAAAKPFVTKHNSLDKTMYLRIAPELFLKQVVAGGVPRVYEIGKNYRNEGMSPQHLQEFTMVEWYASYWSFEENIILLTNLVKELVKEIKGSYKFEYLGTELDFSGEWPKMDYTKSLNDLLGVNILSYDDVEELKKHVLSLKLFDEDDVNGIVSLAGLFDYCYKKKIRPNIIQPTILYNYPNLVPLARPSDENPKITEMFQLLVVGAEICKAYSELVDPELQRAGFEEQMENKEKGDEEAFTIDEDFMLAMEHGMPPMSGLGLGLDRFIAILTNQETLRDVVLFPMMK